MEIAINNTKLALAGVWSTICDYKWSLSPTQAKDKENFKLLTENLKHFENLLTRELYGVQGMDINIEPKEY
jgi:hypothetical protein